MEKADSMGFFPKIKQRTTIRNIVIVLAAIVIGTAATSDALAAGHSQARGAGHTRSTLGGPITSPPPSMAPSFNPSYQYVVPQAPETPVSPAGPGSVFGE
jgi:hypothetical protein